MQPKENEYGFAAHEHRYCPRLSPVREEAKGGGPSRRDSLCPFKNRRMDDLSILVPTDACMYIQRVSQQ